MLDLKKAKACPKDLTMAGELAYFAPAMVPLDGAGMAQAEKHGTKIR
jgi:hypothetical protein